jgi:hypothetical protein
MYRVDRERDESCSDLHPIAWDFGARAYLSYIAGGFSLGPEVSALSICFNKEF